MGRKEKKDKKGFERIGVKRRTSISQQKLKLKAKFLVVSAKDEMKLSRTVDAIVEDVTSSSLVFQTRSMVIDELHLSYNDSPMMRNKLILEMDLPQYNHKIRALGEVSWYERSLVSGDPLFHVGVKLIEISDEDREVLKRFLVDSKKAVQALSIT